MSIYVTSNKLEAQGACSFEHRRFLKHFGPRAKVTLANCKKAARLGFPAGWTAQEYLSGVTLQRYNRLSEALLERESTYPYNNAPLRRAAWAAFAAAALHLRIKKTGQGFDALVV